MTARPKGDYGFDAPWVPWLWFGLAALYVAFSIVNLLSGAWPGAIVTGVLALAFAAGGALYVRSTTRGKFEVWAGLLDALPHKGVRDIVDLGCGRGAVAIAAALRVPDAQVTGVDLWRSIDQSGNDPASTEANARANGVDDRITLVTGNMTELPLPDASADLVVSSLAIHNIHDPAGRAAAVREGWRILRPGGRMVIADLPKIREYAPVLRDLGASVDGPHPIGWRMWWSGPWMPSRVLTATKPSR